MCDDWLTGVKVPMTREQFQLLPRNPTYAYDYLEGAAYLSPRPRYYHAILPFEPAPILERPQDKAILRPLRDTDWDSLGAVFADAFRDQPPFGHLLAEPRSAAGAQCLAHTRGGADGPLIPQATWVAVDAEDRPRGALLVTLMPAGDPSFIGSYQWSEPPPSDVLERRLGRPHLTWIFVSHDAMGRGLGTSLLQASIAALRSMGYRELASTFMLGNTSSLLWHWRTGFRLVAYPFSRRVR